MTFPSKLGRRDQILISINLMDREKVQEREESTAPKICGFLNGTNETNFSGPTSQEPPVYPVMETGKYFYVSQNCFFLVLSLTSITLTHVQSLKSGRLYKTSCFHSLVYSALYHNRLTFPKYYFLCGPLIKNL